MTDDELRRTLPRDCSFVIRNAKEIVRSAWLESAAWERLLPEVRQADPKALARLVRELVAKAGPVPPRRKQGRKRSGPPPLSQAECQRLWRVYKLTTFDQARCETCATEIAERLGLASEKTIFIWRGLKNHVVGKRSRALFWWLKANIKDLRGPQKR